LRAKSARSAALSSACRRVALSRLVRSAGVSFGTASPRHQAVVTSQPCSWKLGVAGSAWVRLVTAKARSLPPSSDGRTSASPTRTKSSCHCDNESSIAGPL